MKQPCVHLLASKWHGTLFVGVTSDLITRIWQHKSDYAERFTKKHGVHDLVWFEQHESMESAILREKATKAWQRAWQFSLIEESNPKWIDLYPGLC